MLFSTDLNARMAKVKGRFYERTLEMATNVIAHRNFTLCGIELTGPVERRFLPEDGGLLVVQSVDPKGRVHSFDVWPAPGLRSMAGRVGRQYRRREARAGREMRYSYFVSESWTSPEVTAAFDKILAAFYPQDHGSHCTGFDGPSPY